MRRIPGRVADTLTTRILDVLVKEKVLPNRDRTDWQDFTSFREHVRSSFSVPATTITPLMARILYGIARLARPRRILGIGTYAGNALVWLIGPGFGERSEYGGELAVGVDTDSKATRFARENMRRLGVDERVRMLCRDGLVAVEELQQSWDLVLLDADDPVSRKGIYLPLLERVYPHLRTGGLLLAHDICVPLFREQMAAYQAKVRDQRRFRISVPLEVDECGLEVSVKQAIGGGAR